MAEKKFSIGEAFGFAWNTAVNNFGFFVGLLFILFLINFIPAFLAGIFRPFCPLSFFISLAGWIIQMIASIGLIKIALRFCDNEKGLYSDLYRYGHLFFKYLIGSTLYGLAVMGGLILLIIPGIIWGIQFSFFPYFTVEKEAAPLEALKKSSLLTAGVKWPLFWFYLLIIGFNILGFLFFLIGLLITIPASMLAHAWVYRKLLAQTNLS
jgi:hypothetical protein